ncbi:hypothetical protein ES703_94426 [subsurface metagenome]
MELMKLSLVTRSARSAREILSPMALRTSSDSSLLSRETLIRSCSASGMEISVREVIVWSKGWVISPSILPRNLSLEMVSLKLVVGAKSICSRRGRMIAEACPSSLSMVSIISVAEGYLR